MGRWESIDRYMILSSDAHAGAQMADYKAYLEKKWHAEFDAWLAGVVNPWTDIHDRRNFDSDARLAAMDAEGITGEVLFPNTLPPFYDILTHLSGVPRDPREFERRWAGLQAHNRWLVDFCDQLPERRRGLIQLLPNDVDAAVAEMHWAARHRVIGGVMLPAVPPNHVVAPYHHERYEPIWATAAQLGFPVHQHQGSGSPDPHTTKPFGSSVTYVDHEIWTRLTLGHLVVSGVFERHPKLRVVWTEMPGLRWVVEELDRVTRQLRVIQARYADLPRQLNFASTFGSEQVDGLSRLPIEYFQRNCYVGASMLSPFDVQFIEPLGIDRIMWGHDGPHPEGSDGHTLEALRMNFHAFSVDDCRTMFTRTAAELYGFDVEGLTKIAEKIGPEIARVHEPLPERPLSRGSAFWDPSEFESVLGSQRAISRGRAGAGERVERYS